MGLSHLRCRLPRPVSSLWPRFFCFFWTLESQTRLPFIVTTPCVLLALRWRSVQRERSRGGREDFPATRGLQGSSPAGVSTRRETVSQEAQARPQGGRHPVLSQEASRDKGAVNTQKLIGGFVCLFVLRMREFSSIGVSTLRETVSQEGRVRPHGGGWAVPWREASRDMAKTSGSLQYSKVQHSSHLIFFWSTIDQFLRSTSQSQGTPPSVWDVFVLKRFTAWLHWSNQSIVYLVIAVISQSTHPSIDQSINQPNKHTTKQTPNQYFNESTQQSINQATRPSVSTYISPPISKWTNQSRNQATVQPINLS